MLIEIGKTPDEPDNAKLCFWLPPETPFGNLTLKHLKIIQRLDQANKRIIETGAYWSNAREQKVPSSCSFKLHQLANEELIYHLRRAADEIIGLVWFLLEFERTREYPSEIKIDRIALVLYQREDSRLKLFEPHIGLFSHLNDISNAFKHSFVNSDINVAGADGPTICALDMKYNKSKNDVEFYTVSLSALVLSYNAFYKDADAFLREFSKKDLQIGRAHV